MFCLSTTLQSAKLAVARWPVACKKLIGPVHFSKSRVRMARRKNRTFIDVFLNMREQQCLYLWNTIEEKPRSINKSDRNIGSNQRPFFSCNFPLNAHDVTDFWVLSSRVKYCGSRFNFFVFANRCGNFCWKFGNPTINSHFRFCSVWLRSKSKSKQVMSLPFLVYYAPLRRRGGILFC